MAWNRDASGYRLPTEAEWEYACRAGTTTPFSMGGSITTEQANYKGIFPYNGGAKGEYRGKTTAVGSFAPNAWGLYDTHGNVGDWLGDYSSGAQSDPTGSPSGRFRVYRGGAWDKDARSLRSAMRSGSTPFFLNGSGFRLARNAE